MVQETEIAKYYHLPVDSAVHVLPLAPKFRTAILEGINLEYKTAGSAVMRRNTLANHGIHCFLLLSILNVFLSYGTGNRNCNVITFACGFRCTVLTFVLKFRTGSLGCNNMEYKPVSCYKEKIVWCFMLF